MIFFTAPRNFTLVRASEQILDVPRLLLLVLLAVRMDFWPRHIAVYIPSSHVWYVDRYVISIGAYTFALAFARAADADDANLYAYVKHRNRNGR